MHVTAKVDYGVRAMIELAAADGGPVKGEVIAASQEIPLKFLENIMMELRHGRLIYSQRGAEGGYRLARPAQEITIAEIIRTVDGPIAQVRSQRPEHVEYPSPAQPLRDVWIAVRRNMRAVLEEVTLADIANDSLPDAVVQLVEEPAAWEPR
jgi:Rrf2 family protein